MLERERYSLRYEGKYSSIPHFVDADHQCCDELVGKDCHGKLLTEYQLTEVICDNELGQKFDPIIYSFYVCDKCYEDNSVPVLMGFTKKLAKFRSMNHEKYVRSNGHLVSHLLGPLGNAEKTFQTLPEIAGSNECGPANAECNLKEVENA